MKQIVMVCLLLLMSVYTERIYSVFGEEGRFANAVAWAESSMRPTVWSWTGCCYGLFQINIQAHWNEIPGSNWNEKVAWLSVPENNIKLAKQIRDRDGWVPWDVVSSGAMWRYY